MLDWIARLYRWLCGYPPCGDCRRHEHLNEAGYCLACCARAWENDPARSAESEEEAAFLRAEAQLCECCHLKPKGQRCEGYCEGCYAEYLAQLQDSEPVGPPRDERDDW